MMSEAQVRKLVLWLNGGTFAVILGLAANSYRIGMMVERIDSTVTQGVSVHDFSLWASRTATATTGFHPADMESIHREHRADSRDSILTRD